MRAHDIAGVRPRRPKRTTIPARGKPKLPDLLRRDFSTGAPDRAWCSDITYIRTGEGWLTWPWCSTCSRRLLGYAMSGRSTPAWCKTPSTWPATPEAAAPPASCSTDGSQFRNTAAGWGLAQIG